MVVWLSEYNFWCQLLVWKTQGCSGPAASKIPGREIAVFSSKTAANNCYITNLVFTDHSPLRAMLKAKHPSGKLARWAAVIAELDVDIQYRPGRRNANADALYRAPVGEAEETSVSQPVLQVTNESSGNTSIPSAEMVELQQGDPQLRQVRDYLQSRVLPAVEKTARILVL